jgi:DNA invertase Pin-like site-specific DNA recombinase
MNKAETRRLMIMMQQEAYEDKRYHFLALGNKGQYTEPQKRYAFELISEYGIRATARILKIPRRTLQRWCIKYNIYVRLCPSWVHEWAERRRKRKEFWARRGYY